MKQKVIVVHEKWDPAVLFVASSLDKVSDELGKRGIKWVDVQVDEFEVDA